jgi:tetratricopeptide (TPR) repeat protein
VRYWNQKGVVTIELDGYEKIPGFLREIAVTSTRTNSALAAARTLGAVEPPPMSVAPLLDVMEALRERLSEVIGQARDIGLLPDENEPPVEGPSRSSDVDEAGDWIRRKARALLDLATAIVGLVPLDNPTDWITLGDLLYEQGDAAAAIRAYQAVLRPSAERRVTPVKIVRRIKGNLARAFAHEGHYGRAEWLLRQCVFGTNAPNKSNDRGRWDVFQGLDIDALRERPTDAAELAHAISRRVERLRDDGHPSEAFVAVAEVRHVLEPLLGIQRRASAPPGDDLFGAERVLINAQRSWRIRGIARESQGRPFNPKAWALNVLGKGYRLSAELALDLHRADARCFWQHADGYLHDASKLDPLLPFPYAHRLHLLAHQRLDQHDRATLDRHLNKDLVHLARHDGSEAVRRRLRDDFPNAIIP